MDKVGEPTMSLDTLSGEAANAAALRFFATDKTTDAVDQAILHSGDHLPELPQVSRKCRPAQEEELEVSNQCARNVRASYTLQAPAHSQAQWQIQPTRQQSEEHTNVREDTVASRSHVNHSRQLVVAAAFNSSEPIFGLPPRQFTPEPAPPPPRTTRFPTRQEWDQMTLAAAAGTGTPEGDNCHPTKVRILGLPEHHLEDALPEQFQDQVDWLVNMAEVTLDGLNTATRTPAIRGNFRASGTPPLWPNVAPWPTILDTASTAIRDCFLNVKEVVYAASNHKVQIFPVYLSCNYGRGSNRIQQQDRV